MRPSVSEWGLRCFDRCVLAEKGVCDSAPAVYSFERWRLWWPRSDTGVPAVC